MEDFIMKRLSINTVIILVICFLLGSGYSYNSKPASATNDSLVLASVKKSVAASVTPTIAPVVLPTINVNVAPANVNIENQPAPVNVVNNNYQTTTLVVNCKCDCNCRCQSVEPSPVPTVTVAPTITPTLSPTPTPTQGPKGDDINFNIFPPKIHGLRIEENGSIVLLIINDKRSISCSLLMYISERGIDYAGAGKNDLGRIGSIVDSQPEGAICDYETGYRLSDFQSGATITFSVSYYLMVNEGVINESDISNLITTIVP
jgi:hypothetical protein